MFVLTTPFPERVKLDKKDQRILTELTTNARNSISQIAKHVGLKQESVCYRLRRLKEKKILLGCNTIINPRALAYTSYHLFLRLNKPADMDAVITFLKKEPSVNVILQYLGKWDLEISLGIRDPQELDAFRSRLRAITNLQEEMQVLLLDNITRAPLPRVALPELEQKNPEKKLEVAPTRIDEQDKILLRALATNGDAPITSLCESTGLSRDQVTYRMRQLKKKGVILGFMPIINHAALGIQIRTVLLKLHNREKSKELEEWIKMSNTIFWAAKTLGPYDYVLMMGTKTPTEFYESLTSLREQFSGHIAHHEILDAYRQHKFSFIPESIID